MLSNPVLGDKALAVTSASAVATVEDAPGLMLIHSGDRLMVPGLEQFPLGITRGGKWSGTLMNISAYCREKTGRAWNEAHAKTVKKNEGVSLHVLKNEELKKQLSAELDAFRSPFHAKLKTISAVINARADAHVTKLRVRRTTKGIAFDQTTLIKAESETARMAAELAATQAELAALKAAIPAGLQKKIKAAAESKPIDVPSTQAPAPYAPPIDIPAAAPAAPANK